MVSSPWKKHHIARSGQQEQQRAKTGQDTAQPVSSRRGEGAGHTSPKTRHTLCHQALLKGTGKSHEKRCKESGEIDQVVVHNKNMEFKDGTRSKQSEHTRCMDRHRLGRMLRREAEYSLRTHRMVRSCVCHHMRGH